MKDILSFLEDGEREVMIKSLRDIPREIMMWLPANTIREFPTTAQRLVEGYYGDFRAIFYADADSIAGTLLY